MEKSTVFWIILVVIILWLIFAGSANKENFIVSSNYGYVSPFYGDYGYTAEHEFLKDWYNSPYFNNVPGQCIVPGQTNFNCVDDELMNGRSYDTAVMRCTSPPSVDARCSSYY